MVDTVAVELHLPADIAAAICGQPGGQVGTDEPLRVSLAIGLFAQHAMTLAKAASLAGMSRVEFASLLKRVGFHACEYADSEYQQDLAFMAHVRESQGG